FETRARDCKFVPIVGLAGRIDNTSKNKGKLYCFLPLPETEDDFSISINGCFAVSKNRRHLENSMTNDDLASDDLLLRKGLWNKYLFEDIIPVAWKRFLSEVKNYVSFNEIYTFWPIPMNGYYRNLDEKRCLWANLLQNVINQLNPDMQVFRGPSKYLSINNGYLAAKTFGRFSELSKLMAKLRFPVFADIPESIVVKLEKSILSRNLKYITPEKVCEHLKSLYEHTDLKDYEKLLLLEYILKVNCVSNLHQLPLLPIENKSFATFKPRTRFENYYITSKKEHMLIDKGFMGKIVDNTIGNDLLAILQNYAIKNENINIEILSESEFAKILRENIKSYNDGSSESSKEIKISRNKLQRIYDIWDHLQQTNRNLTAFLDVYLLPIDKSDNYNIITLRELGAGPKCLCRSANNISIFRDIIQILSLLGSIFIKVDSEQLLRYEKLKNYVIEVDNIKAVLLSLGEYHSFPSNLVQANLDNSQR
ncbi:3291_t:CDS:2, partial [Dentiscutata heterogama]